VTTGKDITGKKAYGIIVGDQARQRGILVDVVGVENSSNTLSALEHAKEKFHLDPPLVTTDFSPNLVDPIHEVFGGNVHQIDGFHVMQELNNGIRRDILDYRYREFRSGIKEYRAYRDWITAIQKTFKSTGEYSITRLRIKPR